MQHKTFTVIELNGIPYSGDCSRFLGCDQTIVEDAVPLQACAEDMAAHKAATSLFRRIDSEEKELTFALEDSLGTVSRYSAKRVWDINPTIVVGRSYTVRRLIVDRV